MIQRIQSLYLLVADLLIALLFFLPFAEISANDGKLFIFYLSGIVSAGAETESMMQKSWPLLALTMIIAGLLLVVIFLYKNRPLQQKLSYFSIILLIGLSISIFFTIWSCSNIPGGNYHLRYSLTFPLIAIILVYLAIKAIAKDEKLVKSIDRIR